MGGSRVAREPIFARISRLMSCRQLSLVHDGENNASKMATTALLFLSNLLPATKVDAKDKWIMEDRGIDERKHTWT